MQKCYLNTEHDWGKEIHLFPGFLWECGCAPHYVQSGEARAGVWCRYKFTQERSVVMLKECIASLSFTLMGGRTSAVTSSPVTGGGAVAASCPATGATCYPFARPGTGGTAEPPHRDWHRCWYSAVP